MFSISESYTSDDLTTHVQYHNHGVGNYRNYTLADIRERTSGSNWKNYPIMGGKSEVLDLLIKRMNLLRRKETIASILSVLAWFNTQKPRQLESKWDENMRNKKALYKLILESDQKIILMSASPVKYDEMYDPDRTFHHILYGNVNFQRDEVSSNNVRNIPHVGTPTRHVFAGGALSYEQYEDSEKEREDKLKDKIARNTEYGRIN